MPYKMDNTMKRREFLRSAAIVAATGSIAVPLQASPQGGMLLDAQLSSSEEEKKESLPPRGEVGWGLTLISFIVPQRLQEGHLPIHFTLSCPQ